MVAREVARQANRTMPVRMIGEARAALAPQVLRPDLDVSAEVAVESAVMEEAGSGKLGRCGPNEAVGWWAWDQD